jgi:glycine cleavage system regulatory protein
MECSVVMTMIGRDRPGLVEALARLVADHGGNWLESRMSRLGGHFAGILRVSAPSGSQRALIAALQGLESVGLKVVVHSGEVEQESRFQGLSRLDILGQDRPGIVRQIARTLAQHGVNVEELETECRSAAMSGETLFRARAILGIPQGCDSRVLREELERIAADLIVEITLADLSDAKGPNQA